MLRRVWASYYFLLGKSVFDIFGVNIVQKLIDFGKIYGLVEKLRGPPEIWADLGPE